MDGAHALACALRQQPDRPPLPTFTVGQRYVRAYSSFRMVVLSLSRSLEGVEVVTFQWTHATTARTAGDVDACRNDGGEAVTSCGVWLPEAAR